MKKKENKKMNTMQEMKK